MAAALIVVIVEFAALAESSVYENRIIDGNAIAVLDDERRTAVATIFYKAIDRLIPFHRRTDQLTAELIEQQIAAPRCDD